MKRDRRAQLKELKQQKAAGGQLSNRQQTRLDYLQKRAQDSKPAKQPQRPQPMPGWKPLNEQPGVLQPALDGVAQAAPGMPIRDMAERMGGQELRPDNMEMQQPFPMPRGGMEEMRGGYNFDRNALPGSSGNMGGISNAGYQSQGLNRMRGGIQGNMGGISNAGYRSQGQSPDPMIGGRFGGGPTRNWGAAPGLMGLGQRAANG